MRIVKAPEYYENNSQRSVFLAGGITGCEDWQSRVEKLLDEKNEEGIIYNPRRDKFPIGDPDEASKQIEWEFYYLTEVANVISFWFAGGDSVQPIALYELGRYATMFKYQERLDMLVVGVDPNYKRIFDVVKQLHLIDKSITGDRMAHTLEDHAFNIYHAMFKESKYGAR